MAPEVASKVQSQSLKTISYFVFVAVDLLKRSIDSFSIFH